MSYPIEDFTVEKLGVETYDHATRCGEYQAWLDMQDGKEVDEDADEYAHDCDGCGECWNWFVEHAQEIFNAWCDNDYDFYVFIDGGPCNWQGRRGWATERVSTIEDILRVISHGDDSFTVTPEVCNGRKFLHVRHSCHDIPCGAGWDVEVVGPPPESDTPIYRNEQDSSDVIGYVFNSYYPEKNGYEVTIVEELDADAKFADDRIIALPVFSDTGEVIRWVKDWGSE